MRQPSNSPTNSLKAYSSVYYHSVSTQTIAANSEAVYLFDSTDVDPFSNFDLSTYRFYSRNSNWYNFQYSIPVVSHSVVTGSPYISSRVLINGTGNNYGYDFQSNLIASTVYFFKGEGRVYLKSGDWISLYVRAQVQQATYARNSGAISSHRFQIEEV